MAKKVLVSGGISGDIYVIDNISGKLYGNLLAEIFVIDYVMYIVIRQKALIKKGLFIKRRSIYN